MKVKIKTLAWKKTFTLNLADHIDIMGLGKGGRGDCPLDFSIFSKKGCFLVLSGKKQISPPLALP